MDSHAAYQKDYLSQCLKYSKEYQADDVGGVIKTIPQKESLMAKAIAICLSTFFGAGTSYFRVGSKKPRWVDTVFGGCYKREVFEKVGLFDERLIRSQDIEFNRRLRKAGGKILLVPEITAFYYPHSNFKKFLKHNFNDGVWTTYPLKFGIRIFSLRHLLPLIFVSGLIGLFLLSLLSNFFFFLFLLALFFYFLMNLYFSFKIAKKEKDFRFFFLMPLIFANRHFGYGLGSLWGLIKILL
jgi:GT2 family glycosyltransferase